MCTCSVAIALMVHVSAALCGSVENQLPTGALARLGEVRDNQPEIYELVVSQDGRYLAAVDSFKELRIWDLRKHELSKKIALPEYVRSWSFSPDGKTGVTVTNPPFILKKLPNGNFANPDSPRFHCHFWNVALGKMHADGWPDGLEGTSARVAYSQKGERIAIATSKGLYLLTPNHANKTVGKPMVIVGVSVFHVGFSANGKTLYLETTDGLGTNSLRLVDPYTGQFIGTLESSGGAFSIRRLGFSRDGRHLGLFVHKRLEPKARDDRFGDGQFVVKIIDVPSGQILLDRAYNCFDCPEFCLAPNGQTFAVIQKEAPQQRLIHVCDVLSGKTLQFFPRGNVSGLTYAPNGNILASADRDGTVLLWDTSNIRPTTDRPVRFTLKEQENLWDRLGDANAKQALEAVRQFWRDPDSPVFLGKRLTPLANVNAHEVTTWIRELGHDKQATRTRAETELAKLWRSIQPQLKQAIEAAQDLEAKNRLERLWKKTQQPVAMSETLRRLRAIETLEHIATPAAIQVLERMAQGGALYPETEDAKETLERLRQAVK